MAAGQISAFGTRQGLVGLPLIAITVALTPSLAWIQVGQLQNGPSLAEFGPCRKDDPSSSSLRYGSRPDNV